MCKKHENACTVSSPLLPTQSALHPDSKVSILSPATCTMLSIIVQKFRTFQPFFALTSPPGSLSCHSGPWTLKLRVLVLSLRPLYLETPGPCPVTPAFGPWISGSLSCRSGPWNCGFLSCRSGPWTLELRVFVLLLRPLDLGSLGPCDVALDLGTVGPCPVAPGPWTLEFQVFVLSLRPLDLGIAGSCPVTPAFGPWNSESLSCNSGPWTLEL